MALACDDDFLGLITNPPTISNFSPFVFVTVKSRWLHRRACTYPLIVAFVMWLGVSRQSIYQWIVVVRIPNPPLDTTSGYVSAGSKVRGASNGRVKRIVALMYYEHQYCCGIFKRVYRPCKKEYGEPARLYARLTVHV